MKRYITTALLLMLINITAFCQDRDICADFANNTNGTSVTLSMNNDANGCYVLISYKHSYSTAGLAPSAFPHGLELLLTNASFNPPIVSLTGLTGSWFTGAATTSTGTDEVRWKSTFVTGNPPPNCILPNTVLTIKKYITTNPGATSITLSVYELSGVTAGTNAQDRLCYKVATFSTPPQTFSIGPNAQVCTGAFATLSLSPAPPVGASVTWYRSGTNVVCPQTNPWDTSGWGAPAQIAGNSFPTNALIHTECFVAVVKIGCWSYVSNVKTITVCGGAPVATIAISPTGSNPALQLINNQYHACIQWQGSLSLNITSASCPATITWEKKMTGSNTWTAISGTNNATQINTGLLYLLSSVGCNSGYDFRATLVNACGPTYVPITIIIDNHASPGQLHTQSSNFYDVGSGTSTAPVLCYKMGTQLVEIPLCGTIDHWEYQQETAPCSGLYSAWITVPGAGTTGTWWTGNLTATTQYRVLIKNGACATVSTTPVLVKVKPLLAVSIAQPTSPYTCMHPLLTASTTYDACNNSYPLTYQWYQDGIAISGANATHQTYAVLKPGNYSVVVSDGICKSDAKSNVVTICSPVLTVTQSSCCVCSATDHVTIGTLISSNCGPAPTYLWSNGATTPTISVNTAGTYSVTVNFPGTSAACSLHGSAVVGNCAH